MPRSGRPAFVDCDASKKQTFKRARISERWHMYVFKTKELNWSFLWIKNENTFATKSALYDITRTSTETCTHLCMFVYVWCMLTSLRTDTTDKRFARIHIHVYTYVQAHAPQREWKNKPQRTWKNSGLHYSCIKKYKHPHEITTIKAMKNTDN